MRKILNFIKTSDKYTKPNSFISYLDNIIAFIIFSLLKTFRFLSPNLITCASFILFLISITFIFLNCVYLFVFFIFLSYTFDNIDGIWARYFNQTSNFGAWLDSTLDRVKEIIVLGYFVLSFNGILNLLMVVVVCIYTIWLILSLNSIKYLNLKNTKNNKNIKKFRIIAFGPAEFYLLVSLIAIFPNDYKIFPCLLFLIAMIICVVRELIIALSNLFLIKLNK